ncbi:helix-turn-helix transcriptional regulator [Streptomyces sp. NPDC057877]|uniref:helix-turn-helix transcriptional regulator n=1 Tax=Streptomyces sp. NPDC057877 TaxID=3346269 RepID=UPI00368DB79A
MPARRTPRPAWVHQEQLALGQRIAAHRRAAHLSQEQLAERVGVERRTIQRYEAAVSDPRYADLLLLARALNIPLAELVQ